MRECGGPIYKGESYMRKDGKWDRGIESYCECHLCVELREWATISMPCFCANTFGTLHEKAREMMQDVSREVPGLFGEWFGVR